MTSHVISLINPSWYKIRAKPRSGVLLQRIAVEQGVLQVAQLGGSLSVPVAIRSPCRSRAKGVSAPHYGFFGDCDIGDFPMPLNLPSFHSRGRHIVTPKPELVFHEAFHLEAGLH